MNFVNRTMADVRQLTVKDTGETFLVELSEPQDVQSGVTGTALTAEVLNTFSEEVLVEIAEAGQDLRRQIIDEVNIDVLNKLDIIKQEIERVLSDQISAINEKLVYLEKYSDLIKKFVSRPVTCGEWEELGIKWREIEELNLKCFDFDVDQRGIVDRILAKREEAGNE